MNLSAELYPVGPVAVPATVTQASAAFKSKVGKVMGTIVLFFIVYLILVILSVALAAAAIYAGVALVIAFPRMVTLLVGIGLMGLGVMVLFFLVKFIFSVTKFDQSGSIEISESDHPDLFAFIRQLSSETRTAFPKKIFLSPEVNACVFYDSNFWSMFLPIKKNLQIGMGLVNAVNLSEFKAIVAHEFGHFSQRSMKLGSFVYNVNRVIYNMLFENDGYSRTLQQWARASAYFTFFASITIYIVRGIQFVLRGMYGLINKQYLGLSREMEFHADAVAASVSGGNNLVSALRRVELADSCYDVVMATCNEWYKQKKVALNIYLNQQTVFRQVASDYNLALVQHLPVVNQAYLESNRLNRVNFRNQWASHPDLADREAHLNQLGIVSATLDTPAWALFSDAPVWQESLTKKIYEHAGMPEDMILVDQENFEQKFREEIANNEYPKIFNGFYDGREIAVMDLDEVLSNRPATTFQPDSRDSLFSIENGSIAKKIKGLEADLAVLNAIAKKEIDVKSFDLDGEKYERSEAAGFVSTLTSELEQKVQTLGEIDKRAFCFFYEKACAESAEQGHRLKALYNEYFSMRKKSDAFLELANKMLGSLQPIFSGQSLTLEQATAITSSLKESYERKFKIELGNWMEAETFDSDPAFKETVLKFRDSQYAYFANGNFFENELLELNHLAKEGWRMIRQRLNFQFRKLLAMQVQWLEV